ncbi:MAG: hypothetical protein JETT_0123 [Candidatus Jettenia ecosi]|uniref:Uncharacterized protein n=1 Tax=Candidatus Jettenia ecosi TaxID=2494326 RepID=A0A533QFT2_9BACT|nr:MAG: hypothetical protein JETT_0123 [Candidatus Jettenia ecosi]
MDAPCSFSRGIPPFLWNTILGLMHMGYIPARAYNYLNN